MYVLIICFGIVLIIGEVIRLIVEDLEGEPIFYVAGIGIIFNYIFYYKI